MENNINKCKYDKNGFCTSKEEPDLPTCLACLTAHLQNDLLRLYELEDTILTTVKRAEERRTAWLNLTRTLETNEQLIITEFPEKAKQLTEIKKQQDKEQKQNKVAM